MHRLEAIPATEHKKKRSRMMKTAGSAARSFQVTIVGFSRLWWHSDVELGWWRERE